LAVLVAAAHGLGVAQQRQQHLPQLRGLLAAAPAEGARPPGACRRSRSMAAAPLAWLRPVTSTWWPAATSPAATWTPMPPVAPVTTATYRLRVAAAADPVMAHPSL
jgi:hypothetical protein